MALNPLFLNQCFDKNRLKNLITWSLLTIGERQTIETVENLKALGFQFATQAGVSLSVDDLKIPPEKLSLVSQATQQVEATRQAYQRGNLTAIEKLQQLVDTWHRTSETLKQTVVNHFQSTDKLSPVYMMAFSGARGNISQVRQLAGMRGLMADPQGQIIGFPIRSNFREGLTLTEYMISCYGARKGLVDTALRTADAGYLTRRLVDVSQHMIVKAATCATPRGIVLKDLQSSSKVVLPLRERLIGRVLAEDVLAGDELPGRRERPSDQSISTANGHQTGKGSPDTSNVASGDSTQPRQPRLVARRNQEISAKLASCIASCRDAVVIRSPLTCSIRHGVCQLCYGWSLSEGRLVTLGEAVGIIAAQSIGEPGTQLTMRTFHTGGVFSGDVMAEIRAPHDGVVDFPQPLQGLLIRTSHGKIAFLTKAAGSLLLRSDQGLAMGEEGTLFSVEPLTVLFVRQHEKVARTQLMAEFSSMGTEINETVEAKRILFSELVGQVSFANVSLGTRRRGNRDIVQVSRDLGFVWILSGRRSPIAPLLDIYSKGSHLVNQGSLIARLASKQTWHASTSPITADEPYIAKRCTDSNSRQMHSKVTGVNRDPLAILRNRRSILLDERCENRADPNDGLLNASSLAMPSPVGNCSGGTFSAGLRFVPNMGYCAISSSRVKENINPTTDFDDRQTSPALTWPRAEPHLKAAKELPGHQPNTLQERLHYQPRLTIGWRRALIATSSPDCVVFCSFPLESPLQIYPERYLSAVALPQKPLLAPFEAGPAFHRGGWKATHAEQGRASQSDARGGSKAILGEKGGKRLPWPRVASRAGSHRPDPFPSQTSFKEGRGHSKTATRAPDFYWLPGEQKSGQTGLAWIDSRYIGHKFAHGEIVWIDEQNLECRAISPSQASQAQTSLSKDSLVARGVGFPPRGCPISLQGPQGDVTLVQTRATLQGRSYGPTVETRGWTRISSLHSPELNDTHPLAELGGNLVDQAAARQPLGLLASRHHLKNILWFSKGERVGVQRPHFSSIDGKRGGKPNKIDTIKAELSQQGRRVIKGSINNLQLAFATRETNPLVRNIPLSSQQTTRLRNDYQFDIRGLYRADAKDASRLATTFALSRLAACTVSLQQETQLEAKGRPQVPQVSEGEASLREASQGPTGTRTLSRSAKWTSLSGLSRAGAPSRSAKRRTRPAERRTLGSPEREGHSVEQFGTPLGGLSQSGLPFNGLNLGLDGLVKGTNRLQKGIEESGTVWPHEFHLQIKPGWVYCPHEQANLLKFHESIQFCDGIGLDNLCFEPALVYLEAFNTGQFSYSIGDNLMSATLRVQLWQMGLVGRNVEGAPTEPVTRMTSIMQGSLFHHLATQGMDARREEAGQAVSYTNTWASHAPVSNLCRAGSEHLRSVAKSKPIIWTWGQEVLLLLRKMLWFSQAFAPPLAELDGKASFLQTQLQKRAGWGGIPHHNQSSPRGDLYQMLFIRNLLNREPFLWLRAVPVQVQTITNQKARYLGVMSQLQNRLSQVSNAHADNLTADTEMELVIGPESGPGPWNNQFDVAASSKLGEAKLRVKRGLFSIVQAESLLPYGFILGLTTSYLPALSQLKNLKGGGGGVEPVYLHKLAAATWLSARRIVQAVQSTTAGSQLTGWSTRHTSTKERLGGIGVQSPWLEPGIRTPSTVQRNGLAPQAWNASQEPATQDIPSSGLHPMSVPLEGLGSVCRAVNPIPSWGEGGRSSNSVRLPHDSVWGTQLGRSWFFEPGLANPWLWVLIRKGRCYPLSMLEKSKAIFLRRHTLTKISVNKRLPISLTISNCLAFYTKQSLTPLILGSPDIRFNVAPLIPFDAFQTAFLPNPIYWIRFAGDLSPFLCHNQDRVQAESSTKQTAKMLGFRSLRTWRKSHSATYTLRSAQPSELSRPINRSTQGSAATNTGALPPAIDAVVPMVSSSAGEMVSQWASPARSGRENEVLDSYGLGQQTKQQGAASRGVGNVLFTQADYASLASEGHHSKTCVGEFLNIGDEVTSGHATPTSGQVVAIEKDKITLRRTQALLFYAQGVMHVNHGEWVEKNAPILTLTYQKLITGDIVQGIPKIEQFFEAPATKEGEPLPNSLQARLRRSFQRLKQLHSIPQAVKRSLEEIQQILVEGILKVYLSQGVRIADKHLEIVIRQMTSKGQVLDVGNTGLFQGEHVRLDRIERINLATYGQKADYEPAVLGITQASLDSESFISAASFQETTRVLSRDTITGKTDFLRGLKERVVLGDLIQAGTGVDDNINYGLLFGIAPTYGPGARVPTRAL